MDKFKTNPFLAEVESMLTTLGLEVEKARQVVPNGVLLYFDFNDIPMYVCLPDAVLSSYSSICRVEAEVAELNEMDAGRLVYRITEIMNVYDCKPIRVTHKASKSQTRKVLIQFVCDLQMLQVGSLAPILLHCAEVAIQMRDELVTSGQSQAA